MKLNQFLEISIQLLFLIEESFFQFLKKTHSFGEARRGGEIPPKIEPKQHAY